MATLMGDLVREDQDILGLGLFMGIEIDGDAMERGLLVRGAMNLLTRFTAFSRESRPLRHRPHRPPIQC